jgi:NTE family protein
MWADAVFEGGGVKGIGLVGALCVTEEKGFRWKKVAGSSAGSIIATLIAAGYTAQELYRILSRQNFADFIPLPWYQYVPCLGPAAGLWLKKGIYSGNRLECWIEKLLLAKGVRTFADLSEKVQLRIIVSDITRGQLLVLPDDLPSYGIELADMSVARAVRMSCSIPFFFEPMKLIHQPSKTTCYIVDGAVLSNFPVWLFDQEQPRWPTFGFRLVSSDQKETVHRIQGPLTMLRSIFLTMLEAHDNRHIREQEKMRTISVPTLDIKMTDFSISSNKKEELFQSGVKAAERFFHAWTFNHYLTARGIKDQVVYRLKSSSKVGG